MNIESLLFGGISSNVLSQYFGVNSNLTLMMNSLMGGFSTQCIFKLFEGILILHPLILLFSEYKNIFLQLFGPSFL